MPVIYAIARYIGVGFCCCILLLWRYEGIPGADKLHLPNDWPIVGGFGILDIPIIGDLTVGKVKSHAAEQVRLATAAQTAIYNARIEKMVSTAELTAANATLARERALRRMADEAAAEADKRAAEAKRGEEAKAVEVERLRAEADHDVELSRPNQRDREWQSKH
jgi:hypothetical protein